MLFRSASPDPESLGNAALATRARDLPMLNGGILTAQFTFTGVPGDNLHISWPDDGFGPFNGSLHAKMSHLSEINQAEKHRLDGLWNGDFFLYSVRDRNVCHGYPIGWGEMRILL